ncbi:MAG TPA: ABC transporter ATP-binding protein [Candidatus Binataceae bacterium]|nr:ABC transporter ATP-binding protein [Candidatus Binataceae bacterium]
MLPIINVEHLGKRYRIGSRQPYHTLRENLMLTMTAPARWARSLLAPRGERVARGEYVLALDDVSFAVQPGEVLGIVGRNGAGKSTLLKILSRITEPSTGRADLYGRVGSLLEIGTGFHPELSGRDNVYLSGAILGMRRAEIARKFDEIVAFAEVERFIDTPVKHYSSGMYVRLAFGVAAHLEPEILLVDEVLAVGDAAFQKRCLGKMGDVARAGRTVLFVSHNMASIESLCGSCMIIKGGRIDAIGAPAEMVARYMTSELMRDRGGRDLTIHPGRTSFSTPLMTSVKLTSHLEGAANMGGALAVATTFTAPRPLRPILAVTIKTAHGAPIFGVSNRWTRQGFTGPALAAGTITCAFPRLPLMPGTYMLDLYFGDFGDQTRDLDVVLDAVALEVFPTDVYGTGLLPRAMDGPVFCDAEWRVSGDDVSSAATTVPRDPGERLDRR